MRYFCFLMTCVLVGTSVIYSCKTKPTRGISLSQKTEEKEGDDGPRQRDSLEFMKIVDPSLGYVPSGRLSAAIARTESMKRRSRQLGTASLTWTERGPNYDTIGVSNFNTRAGKNATSGFTNAILIDTLNDPSGNTVFFGSTTGGIWKCTDFLSTSPNWHPINDYYETLNVASICQDPTNPNVMYFATGSVYFSPSEVYGDGIWKSVDGGNNWSKLPGTGSLNSAFKIMCDAAGNVYTAQQVGTVPVNQPFGLYRSTDHGSSWTNITPNDLTSEQSCTDIEFSSGGRLQASFGFLNTLVNHRYTDNPSGVTPSSGWNASTGIRSISFPPPAIRMELTSQGSVLYAVTVDGNYNADSCYQSTDNGATWTKQNTAAYPGGVLNNQGWYDVTLSVNPDNAHEFIIGGLDAYKSTDDGQHASQILTHWSGLTPPYVHADHHFMQWWKVGSESRIVIGCDGGIFLSRDGGASFSDRNHHLNVKQFYSCAIHPDAGSPYLIAGAQDNGVQKLEDPGLSGSTEVLGGDGAFVHINQVNPQIQFGAYVYNNYERSSDGGKTWSDIRISNAGLFINPYDYDDGQNILYGSEAKNKIRRWADANTSFGNLSTVLPVTGLNGYASAFKLSPYTSNRVFIGSTTGRLLRLDNANTVSSGTVDANVTVLTGASFPAGFLNCINIGSSDQFLVAVFTNFGVNNIWYSSNGGSTWTGIDGNLPDMPIRWAVFDPQNDNKMYIATSAGVFHTDAVNGGSTVWTPETGFPTVRTDMLQIRASDNALVAATYGRGLYTTVIPATPEVRFTGNSSIVSEKSTGNTGCRNYTDYIVKVSLVAPAVGNAVVNYQVRAGNTAIRGIDFDFTTNGDFSNPSTQHLYSSGQSGTKFLTVRVYDDTEIEPAENFTIDFTVSGSTNAYAGGLKTFSFTITDNDHAPIVLTSGNYSMGSSSFSLGNSSSSPVFDASLRYKRTQFLYRAAELKAAGMTAGKINSFTLNLVKNSHRAFQNVHISMGQTSADFIYNNGFYVIPTTEVKSMSSYATVNGVNSFVLDTPFDWNGEDGLTVEICYDNLTDDASDLADPVRGYSDPIASQFMGSIQYQDEISCGTQFGYSYYFYYGSKPAITFGVTNNGAAVSSALNSSKSEYLGPNSEVYFYSSSGVLMARIKNLSSFDYGCTQVVIDRAGNGTSPFWSNNAANNLMNKTFHVIPTNSNPSGHYDISLYFSQAEVNGWQTATAASINSIQLVKAQGQIKDISPAAPAAAGHVDVVSPTVSNFGSDYVLTFSFTNGFSSFGAGIPGLSPLPVGLLTFNGHLDKNMSLLNWTTTWEINARNFELEKSGDGVNFYRIASIPAAGNSNSERKYSYRDHQLNQMNYYRLRMNDVDGRSTISQVVLIKYDEVSQNIWVVNNPFLTDLDIRFARNASKVKLQLVSASGEVVQQATWDHPSGLIHWNLPAYLARGNYVLRGDVDGQLFTLKLVKQ